MPTLRNLFENAFRPCGQTLYVWGGGWNKEDTGAGEDGMRIGLNPEWKRFFDENAGTYDYAPGSSAGRFTTRWRRSPEFRAMS